MVGLSSDWDSYERAYVTWILILAASVTLGWDKSPEATVSKYRLYVGIQSMVAGNPPLVNYEIANSSAAPTYKVDGLDLGTQYFFVVTAVDGQGFESGYSNEVAYTPMPPPTPIPIQVFVSNPSFDDQSFDTQTPSGWLEWGATSDSYTETIGGSHSGARHLTHYRWSSYKVYTYQIFNLPPGTYRVEVWGMTPTGGQTWTGMVLKDNGADKAWVDFPVKSTYEKLSATINLSSGVLEIGFWTDSPSQSGAWTYIDDVSVTMP